jgi:hypothetical protein
MTDLTGKVTRDEESEQHRRWAFEDLNVRVGEVGEVEGGRGRDGKRWIKGGKFIG